MRSRAALLELKPAPSDDTAPVSREIEKIMETLRARGAASRSSHAVVPKKKDAWRFMSAYKDGFPTLESVARRARRSMKE